MQQKNLILCYWLWKKLYCRIFLEKCFNYLGLNYRKYLKIDKKLFRPSKTRNLLADTSKAKKDLKFNLKTDLDGLIKIMMDNELKKYK